MMLVKSEWVRVTESEILQHFVHLDPIDFRVVELNTVRSFFQSELKIEHLSKNIIGEILSGKVIQTLIILNPQRHIPGLIVCPTVESLVEHVGLESCSHVLRFVCGGRFLPPCEINIGHLADPCCSW